MENIKLEENMVLLEKPLNVLIYIEDNLLERFSSTARVKFKSCSLWIQSSNIIFKSIKCFLLQFFNQKYTIYPTTSDEINIKLWTNFTKYFIIIHDLDLNYNEYLNKKNNSLLINFSKTSNLIIFKLEELNLNKIQDYSNFNLNKDFLKKKISEKFSFNFSTTIEQEFETKTHFIYSKSNAFGSNKNEIINYFKSMDISFIFCDHLEEVKCNFNVDLYYKYLENHDLGKNLILTDCTGSTQPIAENINIDKILVFSNMQINGKGRGENYWISPEGSISFTFSMLINKNTLLFNNLPFVQHISSLAILFAIKSFDCCKNLNLNIKWPNDIYFDSKYKLIGILINSKMKDEMAQFFIGIGINMTNKNPIFCLKDAIKMEKEKSGIENFNDDFNKEILIARILNEMNNLINIFNNNQKEKILELYYQNWLLSEKYIRLENQQVAKIIGLDEDGYLRVILETGETVSLFPDGNRFDILKNLKINESLKKIDY